VPELNKRGIAVLGMKRSMAWRAGEGGVVTAQEALRYA